jgi:hypothetical protein
MYKGGTSVDQSALVTGTTNAALAYLNAPMQQQRAKWLAMEHRTVALRRKQAEGKDPPIVEPSEATDINAAKLTASYLRGPVRHAACNTRHATCNRQHAACNTQQTTRGMQHATDNTRHATRKQTTRIQTKQAYSL